MLQCGTHRRVVPQCGTPNCGSVLWIHRHGPTPSGSSVIAQRCLIPRCATTACGASVVQPRAVRVSLFVECSACVPCACVGSLELLPALSRPAAVLHGRLSAVSLSHRSVSALVRRDEAMTLTFLCFSWVRCRVRVTVHEAKDLMGKIIGTRDPYAHLTRNAMHTCYGPMHTWCAGLIRSYAHLIRSYAHLIRSCSILIRQRT